MSPARPSFRAAFSLIELLVVIGVIAVLIAIIIPAMGHAKGLANKAATISQMGAIRMGLQQYYTDFNMYPPSAPSGAANNRGSAMLTFALMGQYGTGFPMRAAAMGVGKQYGPYLPPDPRSYIGTTTAFGAAPLDHTFVDAWGNEILYFRSTRASPGDVITGITNIFGTGTATTPPPYLFNSTDCLKVLNANPTLTGTPLTLPAPNTSVPFMNLLGSKTNAFTGAALGADSFLLISAGLDAASKTNGHYFTADDIVITKQ